MAKHPHTGPGLNTLVVKNPNTGESAFRGTDVSLAFFFQALSEGASLKELLKAFPDLDHDDVSRVVRMAGGAIDMVIALSGPGPIEQVDERGKTGWENPEGLSTSDPMEYRPFRETVREISDRFWKSKGKPPMPPSRREISDALDDWCKGIATEVEAFRITGAATKAELYAMAIDRGLELNTMFGEEERAEVDAALARLRNKAT